MTKTNYKRPKKILHTLRQLFFYLGKHRFSLFLAAVLVVVSAMASVVGTYLLKPVINQYILPGDVPGLIRMLAGMALLYFIGVGATYGYTQLMVKIAQQTGGELRKELFEKLQQLPLRYFDTHTHGELMSRFTNDMDLLSDALNNSFTAILQNFVMLVGTFTALFLLSVPLSLVVFVCFAGMFLFIRYSGKKSHAYFSLQQEELGRLNGFLEERMQGQKVVKVFRHEEVDFQEFAKQNETLRSAATKAFTYAAP